MTLHHLGGDRASVQLVLGDDATERFVDLFGEHHLQPDAGGCVELTLEPYAHGWRRPQRA